VLRVPLSVIVSAHKGAMNRRPVSLADPDYRKMLFGFSTRFGTPPKSLVDYGFFQPALSNPAGTAQAQCFPPNVIDCPFSFSSPTIGLTYWSSTTRFAVPLTAWAVDLTEGNDRITLKTEQAAPGTLGVRGGRSSSE
jgi:hypothetical protein